jgi:hypothetical protein
MTMPPSPRTSAPGAILEVEFLTRVPGHLKYQWMDPVGLAAISVRGSGPCSASSFLTDAMPSTPCPSAVSASRTKKPFSAPVGRPMHALGHFLKSRSTSAGSHVAPHLWPLLRFADLCDALVPARTGKTDQPMLA